jgi:plastocyanin
MRYNILFIIILAALLVGCSAEQPAQKLDAPAQAVEEPVAIQNSKSTADAAPEPSNEPGLAVVVISDMEFRPHSVTIKAGERAEFVNKDDFSHTATGDDWNAGVIASGQSEIVTFDEPGTYEYVCRFHSGMRGEIIVE